LPSNKPQAQLPAGNRIVNRALGQSINLARHVALRRNGIHQMVQRLFDIVFLRLFAVVFLDWFDGSS